MQFNEWENVRLVEDRKGHDRRYAINCDKIRRELGWSPAHRTERYERSASSNLTSPPQ